MAKKQKHKINARSLENLRPFKKGQSGNPDGRPKSKVLSEAYRAELAKEDKLGRTKAERIAEATVAAALKGKISAASEIADRVEGKPRQAVEIIAKPFERDYSDAFKEFYYKYGCWPTLEEAKEFDKTLPAELLVKRIQ